jgi:hypothetical protein
VACTLRFFVARSWKTSVTDMITNIQHLVLDHRAVIPPPLPPTWRGIFSPLIVLHVQQLATGAGKFFNRSIEAL